MTKERVQWGSFIIISVEFSGSAITVLIIKHTRKIFILSLNMTELK